jgi:hypothetical protein
MNIELTELIDTIIGTYTTHGQRELDDQSLGNLDIVRCLLVHIISNLCANINSAERTTAWSIQEVGQKSRQILDEIQEIVDEV